ncbi:MAG: BrnA antitoxin family protein [Armatimonadetes bacterium]|nr:BrnA antitoxin family protein [Armatimonadota bacterium]
MKKQPIPRFRSEDDEREFWATHDATEFLDLTGAQSILFPNLKPSVKTISLRLPESLLDSLKVVAHRRDVPYQSLIKIILADAVERELNTTKAVP